MVLILISIPTVSHWLKDLISANLSLTISWSVTWGDKLLCGGKYILQFSQRGVVFEASKDLKVSANVHYTRHIPQTRPKTCEGVIHNSIYCHQTVIFIAVKIPMTNLFLWHIYHHKLTWSHRCDDGFRCSSPSTLLFFKS